MKGLHLVPGLLQVVHEAEDDHAALAAACAWARTHGRAEVVAVVAEPGQVVADAGYRRRTEGRASMAGHCRDRPEQGYEQEGLVQLTAPVRYGGAVLGRVVAEARAERAEESQDAVQALAALAGPSLRAALDAGRPREPADTMPEMVGRSPAIDLVRAAVVAAARTTFPVLIEGESGTGKELVARALHRLSARAGRRFVAVNCAAFTDELIEAELFGFARGAFTGAVGPRAGLIEEAAGGSLFLDEVGDLSGKAQAKLLRTLQEREVRRVGENATRTVDVRIIAATNVPLTEAVTARRFRSDLLFRLAVVRIGVPPLRDRLEDLPLLVAGFWRRAMGEVGKQSRLSREALAALGRHTWPGNVRELQNVLSGLAVRAPVRGRVNGADVRAQLSSAAGAEAGVQPLDRLRRQFERRAVAGALVRNAGRRNAAARELGLSRQGLLKAIRRLGLTVDDSTGVA